MKLKLLSTGYWHARWNANRWLQWPKGRSPTMSDGFGWVTEKDLREAVRALDVENVALLKRMEGLEGALQKTMEANPECPLCRAGMEYSPKEVGWWKLNHFDDCDWAIALVEE